MRIIFVLAGGLCLVNASSLLAQQPADVLAMLDTDHDGAVSRAEFTAMQDRNFDRMDANHDGQLTGDERPNYHGARSPAQTKAEFSAMAMSVFNGEDADHDGMLRGKELASFAAHIARRNEPIK
jgi:Ca2+-binding EF-hand superfamily protein